MPTTKKPKKKYRPKPVIHDTMRYVSAGVKPIPQSGLTKLQITNHLALKLMTSGSGRVDDWQIVCNALNIAVVLCDWGVGAQYTQLVKDGMQAHAMCGRRLHEKRKLGYSGAELNAVNTAMEVHDAQLEAVTVIQIEKAIDEVNRRLDKGLFSYTVTSGANCDNNQVPQ